MRTASIWPAPTLTCPAAQAGHGDRGSGEAEHPSNPRAGLEALSAKLSDTRDIKLGTDRVAHFAYVADGTGGMKIVQLFSPDENPNYLGFGRPPDA